MFLVLIIAVIAIAAHLITGFCGNQFRLPGEPLVEPPQRMTKREAIAMTAVVLFPLVVMIMLAAIFSR
ncbi:MAG TPA: hypothetical protein VIY49_18570 [Bryobacteraceae bacterium]